MNATEDRGHDAAREWLLDVALEQVFADGAMRAGLALQARRTRWLAAAGVLLGLGVVAAVAWQVRPSRDRVAVEPQESQAQEPRPLDRLSSIKASELRHLTVETSEATNCMIYVDGTDGLAELRRFGKLRRLVFATMPTWGNKPPERNQDAAVLTPLREMRELEELHLCDVLGLSAAHLEHLRELPALRALGLDGDKLDAATREVLFALPHVRSLSLRMFQIDADLLTGLRAMKLTELHLDACEGLDAAAWRALVELKTLRSLRITNQNGMADDRPELPMAAFLSFRELPALTALDLDECAFAGRLLQGLPVGLQKLNLGDYVMTADSIAALKRLASLRELRFHHNVLSEAAIDLVTSLPLERLMLRGWSDQDVVAAVSRHMTLRELWLQCRDEIDLVPLTEAPLLRRVHMRVADGTLVPDAPAMVEAFKKRGLEVSWNDWND
ncbi:MAG: hypothetical protein R3F29_02610 [Planctomycetota bacterium]